jgi:hypothetical protein
MPELLPWSDKPRLRDPGPNLPFVTVMSYDPDVFSKQIAKVNIPQCSSTYNAH